MQRVIDFLETLRRFGQRLGPYLMLEILLPGGSATYGVSSSPSGEPIRWA